MKYHFPVDPACPQVRQFRDSLDEDPMSAAVPSDVLAEVQADWEHHHATTYHECTLYAVENVEADEDCLP